MISKIKIMRGLKDNLPILEVGEFGYCTDTKELFIGTSEGNKIIDEKNRMVMRDEFTPIIEPEVIYPEGKKGDAYVVGDFEATDFVTLNYKPKDLLLCIEDTTTINEPEKWVSYQKALTPTEQDHFTNLDNPHQVTAEQTGAHSKEESFNIRQSVSYVKFQDFMRKQKDKVKDDVTGNYYIGKLGVSDGVSSINLVPYSYEDYAKDVYRLSFEKVAHFNSAWAHSLGVNVQAIEQNVMNLWDDVGKTLYPNGDVEGVVVPSLVTHIGNYIFYGWTSNNQPLVIPNNVTSIGDYVFYNWDSNDQPLVIPNSVTTIGMHAFGNWVSNNQPLVIPDSVTSIGNYAFTNWVSNNQPLVIPDSVTTIDIAAFSYWWANNQPLVIPDSLTTIPGGVFWGWHSNNQPLVIPDSVTSIEMYAFKEWRSNNQPLVIPDSVTSIDDSAFRDWHSNNQPLVIPDSVQTIGMHAFGNWVSNNQPLVIPDSVTSIGNYAFQSWEVVPYVEMKRTTPPSIANTTFNHQNDAPIYVPDASVNDYKTATNWVTYADRIFPVSEKEV